MGRAVSSLGAALVALTLGSSAGAAQPALAGAWSPAEREAVAALLARVPEAVRARLAATVTRDALRCDDDGWPSSDDALADAATGVHLCAGRVEAPDAVARRVGTALLFAFDRAARWSDDDAWRRLSGWHAAPASGFRQRPENQHAAGFASARGQRSPRWDLATFLAAAWLDEPAADGPIDCRLMSQAAFVRGRVAALAGAGATVAAPWCSAFESWADLDHLADVEVVLAAPSTGMAGSLFGHLFLRLVYRDDAGETPPHLSRAMAFLADNDVPFQVDRGYALKGIAGFYTASLHERSFLHTYRDYAVTEGRDLRRWRLNLTAGERLALVQRLWTVSRGGEYAYYFFRRNCATLMMDLVRDALDPARAVASRGVLAAPPASTLEAWADARGGDGRALLQYVPAPILSFHHEALERSRHRQALEPALVAGAAESQAPALAGALRDARSSDAAARAAAYERLAALLADPRTGANADARAWLADAAAVETELSVLANLDAEARADAARRDRARAARDELRARLAAEARARGDVTVLAAVDAIASDDPQRRLDGYRRLRSAIEQPGRPPALVSRLRLLALLESEVRYDVARLKREPALRDALMFEDLDKTIVEQPYVVESGSAALVDPPIVTAVSTPLRALQRTREAVFQARRLAAPPTAPDDGATILAERDAYDASLARSGIDQMSVSGGVAASAGGAAGALVLGSALYDERLGDHRRFGFPSDTAFVVARSDVWLGAGGADARLPAVLRYEARLFGYRSLRTSMPEAPRSRWPLGWELFADLRGSRARALAAEVQAGWGVLAPLVDRGELADHLLLALGLAYAASFPSASAPAAGTPQALALPLGLELRAAAHHRSWLAARVGAEGRAIVAGAPRRLGLAASAAVEAHFALRATASDGGRDPALLLCAQASRAAPSFTGAPADTELFVRLGVELR